MYEHYFVCFVDFLVLVFEFVDCRVELIVVVQCL